jgi:hypothetical protein
MRRAFDPSMWFAVAVGLLIAMGMIRLGWFLMTGAYESFMDPQVMERLGQLAVVVAIYFVGATLFRHFFGAGKK